MLSYNGAKHLLPGPKLSCHSLHYNDLYLIQNAILNNRVIYLLSVKIDLSFLDMPLKRG